MEKSELSRLIFQKANELEIDFISINTRDEFEKDFSDKELFKKVSELFPDYKTIIACAISYNYDWNNQKSNSIGFIAHYTTANFYKILSNKLKRLGSFIRDTVNPNITNNEFYRVFVNSKIDDKYTCYKTGLGYYSKNSVISIKDNGCKFILGELLLNFRLDKVKLETSDCGNCVICASSCPTGILNNKIINKIFCIHHLSSELNWPNEINNVSFIKYWGVRFFGCTECIDVCPQNIYHSKSTDDKEALIGYIGTNFDVEKVLIFKKDDYKKYFKNNQLGFSWIKPVALARNCLASLFNLGKKDIILEYLNNIKNYNWEIEEINYLINFIKTYLKM